MEKEIPFYEILDEICKENNIKQTILSYGLIRRLTKDEKIHHIIRYQFDLNSANAYHIAGDKFLTYEILKENEVPVIEHKMIFNPNTRSDYYNSQMLEEAKEMLKHYNKIVIKANESCKGKDVYVCLTEKEIGEVTNKLFLENKDSLSVSPYVDIKYEYRAIYLDGEILYIYKKRKPYVIGNGKSSLKELLENTNFKDIYIDISSNLNLEYVPNNGEEITISWKHNLSGGAQPILIDEKEKNLEKIKEVAIKAAKAIDIKFASVDVALTNKEEIFIMEINASVCMNQFTKTAKNGRDIAKQVYEKAIIKMFEK